MPCTLTHKQKNCHFLIKHMTSDIKMNFVRNQKIGTAFFFRVEPFLAYFSDFLWSQRTPKFEFLKSDFTSEMRAWQ